MRCTKNNFYVINVVKISYRSIIHDRHISAYAILADLRLTPTTTALTIKYTQRAELSTFEVYSGSSEGPFFIL